MISMERRDDDGGTAGASDAQGWSGRIARWSHRPERVATSAAACTCSQSIGPLVTPRRTSKGPLVGAMLSPATDAKSW